MTKRNQNQNTTSDTAPATAPEAARAPGDEVCALLTRQAPATRDGRKGMIGVTTDEDSLAAVLVSGDARDAYVGMAGGKAYFTLPAIATRLRRVLDGDGTNGVRVRVVGASVIPCSEVSSALRAFAAALDAVRDSTEQGNEIALGKLTVASLCDSYDDGNLAATSDAMTDLARNMVNAAVDAKIKAARASLAKLVCDVNGKAGSRSCDDTAALETITAALKHAHNVSKDGGVYDCDNAAKSLSAAWDTFCKATAPKHIGLVDLGA